MDTSTDTMISLKTRILDSPSVKVLVAWGCGLLWGVSLVLIVVFFLRWVLSGLFWGSRGDMPVEVQLEIALGLLMLCGSSSLLGFFLARGRRGILAGAVAIPVGGLMGYVACVVSALLPLDFLLRNMSFLQSFRFTGAGFGWYMGTFAAAIVVTMILLSTESFRRPRAGLGLGVVVGLGLSVISGLVLGVGILANDQALNSVVQVPPLMWATVVYFVELTRGQGGWKSFLTWLLLVVITFCLPFVIVPLFAKTT